MAHPSGAEEEVIKKLRRKFAFVRSNPNSRILDNTDYRIDERFTLCANWVGVTAKSEQRRLSHADCYATHIDFFYASHADTTSLFGVSRDGARARRYGPGFTILGKER
jgi:hypothetical protein